MFGAELVIVLLAIYLGARLGGHRYPALPVWPWRPCPDAYFQIKPGAIPFDVIEIIMAVIAAIRSPCRSPAGWITWSASS